MSFFLFWKSVHENPNHSMTITNVAYFVFACRMLKDCFPCCHKLQKFCQITVLPWNKPLTQTDLQFCQLTLSRHIFCEDLVITPGEGKILQKYATLKLSWLLRKTSPHFYEVLWAVAYVLIGCTIRVLFLSETTWVIVFWLAPQFESFKSYHGRSGEGCKLYFVLRIKPSSISPNNLTSKESVYDMLYFCNFCWLIRAICRVPTQFWIYISRLFQDVFQTFSGYVPDLTLPYDLPRSNISAIIFNTI